MLVLVSTKDYSGTEKEHNYKVQKGWALWNPEKVSGTTPHHYPGIFGSYFNKH